jgi:hypothetical protein
MPYSFYTATTGVFGDNERRWEQAHGLPLRVLKGWFGISSTYKVLQCGEDFNATVNRDLYSDNYL